MLTEAHACAATDPVLAHLHQELQEERRALKAEVAAEQAEQEQLRLQVRIAWKQGRPALMLNSSRGYVMSSISSRVKNVEADAGVKVSRLFRV